MICLGANSEPSITGPLGGTLGQPHWITPLNLLQLKLLPMPAATPCRHTSPVPPPIELTVLARTTLEHWDYPIQPITPTISAC